MTRGRIQLLLGSVVALTLVSTGATQLRGENQAAPTPAPSALPSPAPREETQPSARHQWMEVTAYCPCTHCCGPNAAGITASGLPVSHNQGRFVAADTSLLPFGSRLSIPGYHDAASVPVIDRGGAIRGHRLDVFFPTHEQAREWGRRWVLVTVETPVEHASIDE